MDKYSFQIVPPHSGKVRQLRIEGKNLKRLCIILVGFLLINAIALIFNVRHYFIKPGKYELKGVNAELLERLEIAETRAESLSMFFDQLLSKSSVICEIADIEPIDRSKMSYGIGGPMLNKRNPNEHILVSRIRDIDRKLDSLIIYAREENERLQKAKSIFENKKNLIAYTPTILPMHGFISSTFGKRIDPFTGSFKMHEGIDICGKKGTPIKATADGRVAFAGWYYGYGNCVRIDNPYYQTFYAHLNAIKVQVGQKVKRGDIIGTCGGTGSTTGIHLHYEVRIAGKPQNPKNYILPNVVVD